MLNLIKLFLFTLLISSFMMKISMMISKKKINFEKMSPFECGFNPIKNARLPFSMRFFLITIIFLIFDVEIALLIPMINTMIYSNLIIWLMTSSMFLIILLMGLFYEWHQGALNWL